MIMPCDENLFFSLCHDYLHEIFKLSEDYDEKNIVIEQGGNFISPISSTKYYGENREIILLREILKQSFGV